MIYRWLKDREIGDQLTVIDLKSYILKMINIKQKSKIEQIWLFVKNSYVRNKEEDKSEDLFINTNIEGQAVSDETELSTLFRTYEKLNLSINNSKISLWITYHIDGIDKQIKIDTYSSWSVHYLKLMIFYELNSSKNSVEISDDRSAEKEDTEIHSLNQLKLHYSSICLTDSSKSLANYGIIGSIFTSSTRPLTTELKTSSRQGGTQTKQGSISNTDRMMNSYDLTLVIVKRLLTGKLTIGLDFTFNIIKEVHKVNWSEEAPDYREITDGMCLLLYCANTEWPAYDELSVLNIGYGKFRLSRNKPRCPIWENTDVQLRNLGFVKCEWTIKGILKKNLKSKVNSSGRWYDGSLHTFKEMDYYNDWVDLEVSSKRVEIKDVKVSSSEKSNKKNKKQTTISQTSNNTEKLQWDPIDDITNAPSSRLKSGWWCNYSKHFMAEK